MSPLERTIRQARRRLVIDRLLDALPRAWFIALTGSLVPLVIDKFWPLGVAAWVWPVGAMVLATLVASILVWRRRVSPLSAAAEVDRRFQLRERLSSAWSLSEEDRHTSAGQAVWHDALRRVERLAIGERFPLTLSPRQALPLVPLLAIAAIVGFWPPRESGASAKSSAAQVQQAAAARRSAEQLRKQIEERRQTAKEQGLKDAEDLFAQLERQSERLTQPESSDRQQSLSQLRQLAEELERRQRAVGSGKAIEQQLDRLRQIAEGPAEKLADALARGQLQEARRELDKLREQLAAGGLDPAARDQLAQQMEQMQERLQQAIDAQRQQRAELERQAAEHRQAGRHDEAERIQQQLHKLERQQGDAAGLEKMAQQMRAAAESLSKGQAQDAAQQMEQLAQQLDQLDARRQEAEMIADALDDIRDARDRMNCRECQGQGCAECRGQGQPPGPGGAAGQRGQGQGDGLGRGRGAGFRPESKSDTQAFDTNVKQKVGRGAALVTGVADGPNAKGQVQQAIREQFEAVAGAQSDPLVEQPLPRDYREHARDYFDALRTGKK